MAGFGGGFGGQTQLGKAIKPGAAGFSGLRPAPRPGPTGASLTGLTPIPNPKSQVSAPNDPRLPGSPPVPPASPPSSTSSTPAVDPRDSTYYNNIAANNLKVGNQINALNAQSSNLQTNLQSALAQLAYQQPRDQLKLEQGANQRGALYSSVYGQDLGNLNHQYLEKQSGLQQAEGQRAGAIAAQIAGLQQGEPIYEAGQYDAAVGRAIKAAAANPATGQPSAVPAAPSVPAATPPSGISYAPSLRKTGGTFNGAPAAKPPVNKNGTLKVNVPKVKPGQIGYRGGF